MGLFGKKKKVKRVRENILKGAPSKVKECAPKIVIGKKPLHVKVSKAIQRAKDSFIGKDMYLKTDIPGFDKLLEKGIPADSSVIVEGGPGSGKTILCLQIAYNACKKGKRVLFMSFEEPEGKLRQHMKEFGWDSDSIEKAGFFRLHRFSALDVARSVEALLSEAKRELLIDINPVFFPRDFKPDIVMIDSLTSISSAFSGEESRFRIYMEQLFRYLEKEKITSFLIKESGNPAHLGQSSEKAEAVSFLSDGIIVLYNVIFNNGKRASALEILKMRGATIYKKIVEMKITPKGIVVFDNELGEERGNYRLA